MVPKKILVIAPHPDDEVLGCGGTLRKYADLGAKVTVCLVTESYTPEWSERYIAAKAIEIQRSNEILGCDSIELSFPTAKLDTILQKDLALKIGEIIVQKQPEVLYIPHIGDIHKDHRLVHEAALIAARPRADQSIVRVLAYETPSETEWGLIPFVPNSFEDISDTLDRKLEAMGAYRTELCEFPHPRSTVALEALAKKRGSEVGVSAAEAFMLIRSLS